MITLEFIVELKILCFKPIETYDLIRGTQSGKIYAWCNIPAELLVIFIIINTGNVHQARLVRETVARKSDWDVRIKISNEISSSICKAFKNQYTHDTVVRLFRDSKEMLFGM